ncbi:MAG TPA: class I SAM-dependent methyltransferase [Opitutaceae bacterium]|nr:class I SAM-dependent methyltransferase [Opitutaceae bacterium]
MKIADQVRQIYERRPYPFGNNKALKRRSWTLTLEWIDAIGRVEARNRPPARVLLAGCGDGTEAFNLRRELPKAEIVAVDFSRRSIAVARRLQGRAREMRDIRFVAADLTDPRLPARVGGAFDLIICHGVLSYIPRVARVMKNFARCLKADGALYLGVNGSRHVSTRLRLALPDFGYDMNEFRESRRLRDVLKLCDSVVSSDGLPRVSGHGPQFLSSDVFGRLNQCLLQSGWALHGRRAGLSLRGNWSATRLVRRIAEADLHPLLIPRSRSQVCDFLERLSPSQFHRLLLSKKPEANPPWESRGQLLRWRLVLTRMYRVRLPRPGRTVRDRLRRLKIASPVLNLAMEWRMPEWELELLRRGDGDRSLGNALNRIPLSVPFPELRKQLYFLYQLGIINLLPPATGA